MQSCKLVFTRIAYTLSIGAGLVASMFFFVLAYFNYAEAMEMANENVDIPIFSVKDHPAPEKTEKQNPEKSPGGNFDETIQEIEDAPNHEESYEEADILESPEVQQTSSYYEGDFESVGVVYGDDGTRYTWYSQNVLPGGGLDIPGRHVDENEFVCDEEGRIAVASPDYEKGTQIDTPFGPATVYDTGCDSGTVDIYTDY